MAQQSEKIELSVTNFGPIAKADIDLRPLTVFVGPSNTGKSYLAVLIYALHKFFNEYSWHPSLKLPLLIVPPSGADSDLDGHQESKKGRQANALHGIARDSINWMDAITSQEVQSDSSNKIDIPLPESLASVIRQSLVDVSEFEELIIGEMERCFGIDVAKRLIRHSSKGGLKVDISRHIAPQQDVAPIKYELMIGRAKQEFTASLSNDMPLYDAQEIGRRMMLELRFGYDPHQLKRRLSSDDSDELLIPVNRFIDSLIDYIIPSLVGSLNRTVYYLPADRTGIMHAHKVVVGSLLRGAQFGGAKQFAALPSLSGVLADFLEDLIELENRPRTRGFDGERRARHIGNQSLAASLEEKMLLGKIQVENSTVGYPEFYYQPQGWKNNIPLMNSSSMVSELAPVVLYLRHIVRPGDAIIIEEPESHLHPAMQVEFIRQLAAVVKSGVQVIITTHSEWVLEELANLVRLSDLPKSRRKGIKGAEYALKYDQVGAWLFEKKDRPNGSVVKEIKLDKEQGTFPSGFSDVGEDTYNDYAEIFNRISGASMNG